MLTLFRVRRGGWGRKGDDEGSGREREGRERASSTLQERVRSGERKYGATSSVSNASMRSRREQKRAHGWWGRRGEKVEMVVAS